MLVSGRVYNLAKPVLQGLFGMQDMTWQMVQAKFIVSLMRNEATTSWGEKFTKIIQNLRDISMVTMVHAQILTHRIHVCYIYLHEWSWLIFMVSM